MNYVVPNKVTQNRSFKAVQWFSTAGTKDFKNILSGPEMVENHWFIGLARNFVTLICNIPDDYKSHDMTRFITLLWTLVNVGSISSSSSSDGSSSLISAKRSSKSSPSWNQIVVTVVKVSCHIPFMNAITALHCVFKELALLTTNKLRSSNFISVKMHAWTVCVKMQL